MLKVLFCFVASLALFTASASAEGRAIISFERTCRPIVQADSAIMAVLAAFEIQDKGTCQYVPADEPSKRYEFPFIFPARPKGDQGAFRFLVVIDGVESISNTHNLIIAGRGTDTEKRYHRFGVAIWPLPVQPQQ